MKRNAPKVAIITINWNGLSDTSECLESLQYLTYPNAEIVVVDNGSKNNEAKILKQKFPFIKLVKLSTNTGFTGGCNAGIRYAMKNNADYILLLNNDTVVEKDFLDKLVNAYEKDQRMGVVSSKITYYKSDKIWSVGGIVSMVTGMTRMIGKGRQSKEFKKDLEPKYVTGCVMLVSRDVIEKVGILDDIYFAYYEDFDWCLRIRNAGYKIKVVVDSIVHHKKSASAGVKGSNKISSMQAYYRARNSIIFGKKNFKGFNKTLYMTGLFSFSFLYNLTHCNNFNAIKKYFEGLKVGISYSK